MLRLWLTAKVEDGMQAPVLSTARPTLFGHPGFPVCRSRSATEEERRPRQGREQDRYREAGGG